MIAKLSLAVAVASLGFVAAGPALAQSASCPAMDEASAAGLLDKWAKALPGHNADLVLAHYASEHSFKPHDAEAAMSDRTAIRGYWTDFVDGTPTVTVKEAKAAIDCDTVVKTGTKEIVAGGETIPVTFEMEFKNQDGTWLITRHEMSKAG